MAQGGQQRLMVRSAAAIYGGATFLGLVEDLLPGRAGTSLLPGLTAMLVAPLLLAFGQRLPMRAMFLLGPLGVVLIGVALATTQGPGDGAVLYLWPAFWTSYFFGRRGTAVIVVWVAVVHAAVLASLPNGESSDLARWLDVVVATVVVAIVVRAIAARNQELVDRLAVEASHDPLTGLLNRRGFDERFAVERARAEREGSSTAIVMLDIDHFKKINDEHGHDVGDEVLRWLAQQLTEQARTIDLVGRAGGEEFIVLLPRSGTDAALAFAERVRTTVESGDPGIGKGARVTLSAGAVAATPPIDAQRLLEVADQAMYQAKRGGRNRTVAVEHTTAG
jgi:diguanylate cyclase (GGDEF)-like protein